MDKLLIYNIYMVNTIFTSQQGIKIIKIID